MYLFLLYRAAKLLNFPDFMVEYKFYENTF
jgi:hypothetical protein